MLSLLQVGLGTQILFGTQTEESAVTDGNPHLLNLWIHIMSVLCDCVGDTVA